MGVFIDRKYVDEMQSGDPGPRVVEYIPPYFIPADLPGMKNIQIMEDGSLGVVWRVGVPAVESVPGGHAIVARALGLILREVPEGYSFQVLPVRTSNIRRYIDHYNQGASSEGLSGLYAQSVANRWLEARKHGFFPEAPAINFYPVDQDLVFTLRSRPIKWFGGDAEQWGRTLLSMIGVGDIDKAAEERLTRYGNAFRRACQAIEQAAASCDMGMHRMNSNELIEFIQKTVYPDRDLLFNPPRFNGVNSLGEIVGSMGRIQLTDAGAITGKTHQRVAIMMAPPDGVEPGMFADILKIGGNVQVFANIEMLDQLWAKAAIKAQTFFASRMATSFTAVETRERMNSMADATVRLYNGEKLLRVMFGAIVHGKDERDAEERVERVSSIMRRYMEAAPEEKIGENLFLKSLPLGNTPESNSILARSRRMLSDDVADMLPVGGSWEGITDKPLIMFGSRWGNPLFINTQACDSNPHFLVVGGSGSGKSYFVHFVIQQLWRLPDIRIYLISIKPDYRKIAQLQGKYVEIDLDNPISINPFGGAPTKENQAFWVTVLVNMIKEGASHEVVTKVEQNLLGESAIEASRRNWDDENGVARKETILSDIISVLKTSGQDGKRLADRLESYHSGQFSKLFNKPRGISHDDRFIFFNLAKLAGYSCQGVVLLSLFRFINDAMYDEKMRGVLKVLGIDEIWSLLNDEHSAHFLETSFRAYRSLGGLAFAVSQSLSDFDTRVGRVILGNTATKYVLRQQQTELLRLPNYIDLNDTEMNLVASLDIKKRYYSEFFVKMEGQPSTVGRVIADPLQYAIATTDPADEGIFNRLLHMNQGDYTKALDQFMREYPYGRPVHGSH